MLLLDEILVARLLSRLFGALENVGLQRLRLLEDIALRAVLLLLLLERLIADILYVLLILHAVSGLVQLLLLEVFIPVAEVKLSIIQGDRLGQVGQLRIHDWARRVHMQLAANVGRNAQVRVWQVRKRGSIQLNHLRTTHRLR